MGEINLIRDASFLQKLDSQKIRTYYVKIVILNMKEQPIKEIQGKVSSGSITISNSSSVRRAGNITLVAEEKDNDLTNIDNLLSMNKRIKILVGLENHVDSYYDDIIWFNQGIFVITNPSLNHTLNGVQISLQFKDKMCLLNGECGGGLPTSVTFDHYEQRIGYEDGLSTYPGDPNEYTIYNIVGINQRWSPLKGWTATGSYVSGATEAVPQRFYDIIQTLVCNYGGEPIEKIIIQDVPLEIKQSVRFTGSTGAIYLNVNPSEEKKNDRYSSKDSSDIDNKQFRYNEDCGYVYTEYTYPGELVSGIGENVCSVLDKILSQLSNYEYFYDIDGNFVFREKRNYLNTQYDPVQVIWDDDKDKHVTLSGNGMLLSSENYFVDFSNISETAYNFAEGGALVSSYSNSPSFTNIKNDFHVWGKNQDKVPIHYHLAIKEKPSVGTWNIYKENDGSGYKLAPYQGVIHEEDSEKYKEYTAADWRVELYLRGLDKQERGQRPDIFEQEMLDLLPQIWDFKQNKFKTQRVDYPNDLNYWIDFIDPAGLEDISADVIGVKTYSHQQDSIKNLYQPDIPNIILINKDGAEQYVAATQEKCDSIGQEWSYISNDIYGQLTANREGYDAQEVMRNLVYQHTAITSSISLNVLPIYYLDVNTRIGVYDKSSGISGDYIIQSITVPLDAKNTMSISATKAISRD